MSKPLPTLPNMPWNVKQTIIDELDHMTRSALRKCSKELRQIIDNSVMHYPKLYFTISETYITQKFVSEPIETSLMESPIDYSKKPDNSCRVTLHCRRRLFTELVTGQNHVERVVSDLATCLKNPKSSIGYWSINHRSDPLHEDMLMFLTCLKNTLEQLPHQLSVSRLHLRFPGTQEQFLQVLQYIKPGVLTDIYLNNRREVDQLVTTEQWRMAEKVTLENESNIRIQDLLHLSYISIKNYQLTREEMPLLIQAFLTRGNEPHYHIGLPENYKQARISNWMNENKAFYRGQYRKSWQMKIHGTQFHMMIILKKDKLCVRQFLSPIW